MTNTHDFTNVLELIHPEATYLFTDGTFRGLDQIQKAFESTWKKIQNETYQISDIKVVCADELIAVITYKFSWSGVVDGQQKNGEGRGTNVIKKSDMRLQFIHEHLSK